MSASLPAELLCIGDISVDTIVSIDHLPRRDEKQWARLIGEYPGGMAANVAVTYTRLGGSARLVASVGRDAHGALSLGSLRQTAVDVELVAEVEQPTFWTMSLADARGDRAMVEFLSDAIHPPWAAVGDGLGARAAYTIGSEASSATGHFGRMQAYGIATVVDVDYAELESEAALRDLLGVTSILFCNGETARRLTEKRSALDAARSLSELGPGTVAITLGARGAVAYDRDEGSVKVAGHEVEVVDATGAGDCFAGSFLFGRIRRWPLEATVEMANLMAAISTTAYGCQTGVPTRSELLSLPMARDAAFRRLLAA